MRVKRLAFGLVLLVLAIPMLGSDCGPGLGWEADLAAAKVYVTPRWSTDGSRLVFDGSGSIYGYDSYTVSSDGTGLVPLSVDRDEYEADATPDISPDGDWIVFAKIEGGGFSGSRDWDIRISRADGTEQETLTSNSATDIHPVFSPDGGRIAWISGRHLHVMDRDGSDKESIAPSIWAAGLPPQWSPDGSRIAFVALEEREQPERGARHYRYRHFLYVVSPDGSGLQRLSESAKSPPSWSPDGKKLAFGYPLDLVQDALYTINADGSESQEVISFPRREQGWAVSNVSWSPDGSKILFNSSAITVDGAVLWQYPSYRSSSWSPNGERIAVQTEWVFFDMAPDGTDRRLLWTESAVAGNGEGLPDAPPVVVDFREAAGAYDDYAAPGECESSAAHGETVDECKALLKVAAKLSANPPLDWDPQKPLNQWEGLEVRQGNDGSLEVVSLELALRFLTGVIPPELASLPGLTNIDLQLNWLTGGIPPELSSLVHLSEIYVSNNKLGGPISPQLGELPALRQVHLSDNYFTGPLPPELGSFAVLGYLDASNNDLTGPLPPEMGQLSLLEFLDLSFNQIDGPIPPEWGGMRRLSRLILEGNALNDHIPSELGNLSNLRELILSGNELTGPIPGEVVARPSLGILELSNNRLTGPLPLELTQTDYMKVRLNDISLDGCLGPEWDEFLDRTYNDHIDDDYCDEGTPEP